MGNIIFDPVLGWRRGRGSTDERLQNLHRRLVIGPNGYRVLPNQTRTEAAKRRLAIFGCSVTEGQWLADEDTYPYMLQQRFPDWRVEPYGIGAYSTFQNLLQLEAYLVTARPEVVIFGFIASHLERNVANPKLWVPYMDASSEHFGVGVGRRMNTFRPAATLRADGTLKYVQRFAPKTRAELKAMMVYCPDPHHMDEVGAAIVRRARALCDKAGAAFHFAVLRSAASRRGGGVCGPDHLDDDPFITRLRASGISVIDADPRLSFKVSTFDPVDSHPNAEANRHFAQAIGDALEAA